MNRFTCTLISGLGALIRDMQGFRGLRFANFSCQRPRWEGREINDLCEPALAERQNKNKVSAAASLPASLIIFK